MYIKESDVEKAVDLTGFGKFNIKITAVGAFVYLNCAFCMNSIGFVIASAACDYEMATIDKGRFNIAFTLGMVIGTGIWGYFSDLKGRRLGLLISLFIQFVVDALASLVPNYWMIVALKLFSGIGITGQLSVMFPYIGEFQPVKYRNQVMSWMELFWSIGLVVVALLAWGIIPLEVNFRTTYFWFSSWNLFALVCSIPSLMMALFLLGLPETPKFLAEDGQPEALLQVLTRMAIENSGVTAEEFKDKLLKSDIISLNFLARQADQEKIIETDVRSKSEQLAELMQNLKVQIKILLHKPYASRLFIASSIVFCMSSTYFSLMIWFPELFQRFADFERDHPNESASVCGISQKFASNFNTTNENAGDPYGCNTPLDTSVYTHSIWLGVACFPAAIILPLTVDRLGYRIFLILTAITGTLMTVGFFFVKNSLQNIVLSAIFEATTSINVSIIFCILVELFPTNVRVMASAITLFSSRVGSVFGNMLFSFLIDNYCQILIGVMACQLLFATAVCWATPSKSEMKKVQNFEDTEEQVKKKIQDCETIEEYTKAKLQDFEIVDDGDDKKKGRDVQAAEEQTKL